MVESRVVRIHNSLYVNVPADEARRLGIHEGQLVTFEPRPILTLKDVSGALAGRVRVEPWSKSELYPEEDE